MRATVESADVKRVSNKGPNPLFFSVRGLKSAVRFVAVSKGFGSPRFKGSTQGKWLSEIFRFGY